ncbi:MAG: TRAP transporter large permease subunit [Candidatus Methylomirabilota bacterium]|jgi:tripartite ATP-independent transporter DctM subunit
MDRSGGSQPPTPTASLAGLEEKPRLAGEEVSRRPLPGLIDASLRVILAAALFTELGVVFLSTLSRSLLGIPWVWTNEAAEMSLTTIAFLGGAFAYRRGEHAYIRTLLDALPMRWHRACLALIQFLVLIVAITMGMSGYSFFLERWNDLTPVLEMHTGWFVLPLILCMLVLVITAIERLLAQHRPTVLAVGCGLAVLILTLVLSREIWRPWLAGDATLSLALGIFFATVLIGLPVGFALLLSALCYLHTVGTMPTIMLSQTMTRGINGFVLLAVPFFILAGTIMNEGGISRRLVHMVHAFVGHVRGGLFQVMVVSMYIVSGLSGSKAADVAAVGLVMRDMLRQEGYSLEKATAVLASGAVMGETVPPSIPILVLGAVTTISIGTLFVGGLIPAAVVGVCLMVLIYFQFRRSTMARPPRATFRQLAKATLRGLLPLLMPVILFGGILAGVATATEVSSFAVVYGLVLACIIYRELGLRTFIRGLVDCASVSGMILFILGGASSFAWALTVANLPHRLVGLLSGVHQSQWVFMLASIVLLIVTGLILEGLPALLILAPILLPIAGRVGISQLHYGIVLLIAMGIGAFMPPVGVGFYFACAVCETTIEKSSREMIPFVIVLCLGLIIVALVPWFTLFLPARFGLSG